MSNSLYATQWSVNQKQQQEYIRRLETLIGQMEARKKPIVVRSAIPPLQGDWETAWVAATGLPLPIPPGTKLIWYDTAKALMWTYSTVFDTAAGLQSSGTVVRSVDQTYDRPPFRLLGTYDSALFNAMGPSGTIGIRPFSVHEPQSGWMGFKFPFNLYKLVAAGLREIKIIYRLRLDSVTATDKLFMVFAANSGNQWIPNANSQFGFVNLEVVQGTATRTDGGTTMYLGGKTANNSSLASAYSAGVIEMVHANVAEDVGLVTTERLLFQGIHIGTRVDDVLTTGKFGMNFGTIYSYGELPPKEIFPHVEGDNALGVSLLHNGVNGKAWLYGLFSKNTQELIDGQFV